MSDASSPEPKLSLHPIGSLFSGAWELYKARFKTSLKIIILPAFLLGLGQLLTKRSYIPVAFFGGIILFVGEVAFFIGTLALIASFGEGLGPEPAYKRSLKLFWSLLWITALSGCIVLGGYVMLVVPGIWLAISFAFSSYVLLLEGKKGLNALLQSKEYVRGYWWAVVGRNLLLGLAIGGIFLVIYVPVSLLTGSVGGVIMYIILTLLAVPFSIAYEYKLFENLRTLKPHQRIHHATSGRKFLIASGIVGIVAPILIAILVVGLFGLYFLRYGEHPGSGDWKNWFNSVSSAPFVISLDPSSGPVGTEVTIYGIGFAATNTVTFDGLVGMKQPKEASSKDGTLVFTVPDNVGPNCGSNQMCAQFLKVVTPGVYGVSVLANGTSSNSLPFTVTK